MKIYTNAIAKTFINNSKSNATTINFTASADDFVHSNKPLLTINKKTNKKLDQWANDFISLPGSSVEHLMLLKNLISVTFDDDDGLSMLLIESSFEDSPKKMCEGLKDSGFDILSLSKDDIENFQKNIENFKRNFPSRGSDLFFPVFLPLLDEKQIAKVMPYTYNVHLAPLLFDIANGDDEYLSKLDAYIDLKSDIEDKYNIFVCGPDFVKFMNSDCDIQTAKERTEILAAYARFLHPKKDIMLFINLNTFSNLVLSDDDKWEKVNYFMKFTNDPYSNSVNFSLESLDELSNLSGQQLEDAKTILEYDFDDYTFLTSDDIINFTKLSPVKQKRALHYMSQRFRNLSPGFNYLQHLYPRQVYLLVGLDEEQSDFVFSNCKYLRPEQIDSYIDIRTNSNLLKLPLAKRIDLSSEASNISDSLKAFGVKDETFEKIVAQLQNSLRVSDVSVDVPKANITNFFKHFLSNVKVNSSSHWDFDPNLSYCENTLLNNDFLIRSFGKRGLPLSYPRAEFLSDLDLLMKNLPKDKQDDIFHKLAIVPKYSDDKLDGYNGVLAAKNLDLSDAVDKSVYDIVYKFLFSNSVQTGHPELDIILNSLIKAFPEFLNSIGKLQNPTHAYSNDIHTLAVLNNCLSNPDYPNLDPTSKTVIKLMAVFHDIGKADSVIDKGHQVVSAHCVKSILDKLNLPLDIKDRIYELVNNHHWFEEYNTGNLTPEFAAFMFRRLHDFDIAQIFARADLLGVGNSRFDDYCYDLNDYNLRPIRDKIDTIYSTGNAVYTANIINPAKLPKASDFDGNEYKVVNFTNIDPDTDLSVYGFAKGLKKDDVRLLVHMVGDESDLFRFTYLSDITNAGVLSQTLISLNNKRTYCNRKYGVVLSNSPYNVIQMSNSNISSGKKKDLSYAVNMIQFDDNRLNFKNALLVQLGINPLSITESDYAEFYKKYLTNKNMISQFSDNQEYKLGNYTISPIDLKIALQRVMDSFMTPYYDDADSHSEFVAYFPRVTGVVAKCDSIKEVPNYLKDFARQNDLPVFLIGSEW